MESGGRRCRRVSFGRLPAPSQGHRDRRRVGFEPGRLGPGHLRKPQFCGFPGQARSVNPKRRELWGRPVFPNFAAIPEPVDLALTIIPSPGIPDTLAEGAANGLKCALIYAAQFGEGGDAEGMRRAQAVKALCDTHGLRISGPNCMGSVALREKLLLYPAKRVRALRPGAVGVVFQSGGTFQFWLQQASLRGLISPTPCRAATSSISISPTTSASWSTTSTRRSSSAWSRAWRRPHAFMAAAEKALAGRKPIILLKVGRSERGKAATASHTGALAADDAVFDAVCRKYGIVRCPSLDDLMETCLAFAAGRLPKGPRIAMVCYRAAPRAWGARLWERRGRADGAADAGDEGEAPRHDRSGPPGQIRSGCRRRCRRAGCEVRRDLQGGLRRSDRRSCDRAGAPPGQSRRPRTRSRCAP